MVCNSLTPAAPDLASLGGYAGSKPAIVMVRTRVLPTLLGG